MEKPSVGCQIIIGGHADDFCICAYYTPSGKGIKGYNEKIF